MSKESHGKAGSKGNGTSSPSLPSLHSQPFCHMTGVLPVPFRSKKEVLVPLRVLKCSFCSTFKDINEEESFGSAF